MGFSVHDTIVVFDRIRENLTVNRGKKIDLGEVIKFSVKETFARSVNTSLTLIVILTVLLAFGPTSLFYFILTILVGTIFGTYSSIFVASPLLYLWQKK
jgi:preprotein translocase SecF subunit